MKPDIRLIVLPDSRNTNISLLSRWSQFGPAEVSLKNSVALNLHRARRDGECLWIQAAAVNPLIINMISRACRVLGVKHWFLGVVDLLGAASVHYLSTAFRRSMRLQMGCWLSSIRKSGVPVVKVLFLLEN